MATEWGRAGPDPSLENVMADPMVQLVMRRDGLTPDDVKAVIEAARRRQHPKAEATAASMTSLAVDEETRDAAQSAV